MNISPRCHAVDTSNGRISVAEYGQGAPTIVMIHGNSSCREVFSRQAQSRLAQSCRIVTFDLPGHGRSSDAPDPVRTYTRAGLADAVQELLGHLGIAEAVLVGWSLGGHLAIELLPRFAGMRGLLVTGSPPVRAGGMAEGFRILPGGGFAGRRDLDEADVDDFARAMFGEPVEPFLRQAIVRADGRFRPRLFEASREGVGIDQRLAVEASRVPIAVVNGAEDPLIRLDYLDTVAYGNLWSGRCHRFAGVGHAPFWHAPEVFNDLLERFVRDVGAGAAAPAAGAGVS
mgnify:CR=1 FL=1